MKENKNLMWLLVVLVILAVIFFGYYFYKNNSQKDVVIKNISSQNNPESVGMEKVDVDNLVSGIKNDYKNSTQFQECIGMDMGIKSCLRDAVMTRVKQEDNVNLCNDLSSESDINSCKNSFYTEKAEKTGDVSVCDNLTDKNSCLERVYTKRAKESKDEKICESLEQDYQKQQCKSSVIRAVAVESGNSAVCDKLIFTRVEGEGENKIEVKETMDAEMCKEEVKMEIDMKKMEAEMKKRDEEQQRQMEEENKKVEEPVI